MEETYSIGDFVYLKTDPDQNKRLITGILIRDKQVVTYGLTCGSNEETWHYSFEISIDKTL